MANGHLSEAACLIEQGATYRRRVGLKPLRETGEPTFAGFKTGAFAIYFGDAPFYHFDLEGRWQRAFVDGTHFLKALDGTVQSIDRVREGPNLVLKRTTLASAESTDFDLRVRSMALALFEDLGAGKLGRVEPSSPGATALASDELRDFLERIARWDAAAWLAHRGRYSATYGPMPFLPPECLNAVVLQATLGHAAQFASGRTPSAEPCKRSTAEFEQHAREVAALWGRRLLQSRTVFLAGGDVLLLPAEDVKDYLTAIGGVFPIEPTVQKHRRDRAADAGDMSTRFDGVHVFLDEFVPGRPPRGAWNEFAALGLNRVSIGVASGDSEIRARHHQQWTNEDLRAAFADLKAAGIGASVLTLVGAGGLDRSASHVKETVALIESLDLAPGDFVFLLDENELHDPLILPRSLTPLLGSAWQEQQSKLKEALGSLKQRKVKVLPYTMEKQGI